MRGVARNGEVRGITILYDQAMEGTMDPLVAAMSSAFVPFATALRASAGVGRRPRRKVEYGSGVVVSPAGHILTDRQLIDGCNVIALPGIGNAERVAEDKAASSRCCASMARETSCRSHDRRRRPAARALTLVGIADPQAQGGGSAISAVAPRRGSAARRARNRAGARFLRRRRARRARAASPAWWC